MAIGGKLSQQAEFKTKNMLLEKEQQQEPESCTEDTDTQIEVLFGFVLLLFQHVFDPHNLMHVIDLRMMGRFECAQLNSVSCK